MRFFTETGSQYEIKNRRLRRIPGGDAKPLRRDEGWLDIKVIIALDEGRPAVIWLEPLAPHADMTVHVTSTVTTIIEEQP